MKHIKLNKVLILFGIIAAFVSFISCEDKNKNTGDSAAPVIKAIYLEDANSSVPDRLVDFARLGQTIRIEGESLLGVNKLTINGYECLFNPALMTNTSMFIQISNKVPTIDASEDVRNKIRLDKGSQYCIYNFEIRAAAPSITTVSHTMAQAGDEITITGNGLQEVSQVLFPGNIPGAKISSDDVDGKWCKVTVPAGITTSGSISVTCANGGVYSPPYFNYKEGMLHNFDDVQNYSWGSGIDNTALTALIPASGNCKSQGGYQVFNSGGNLGAGADQRFWLNSDKIMPIMQNLPNLPLTTLTNQCGIQMDIYVEGTWNSGIIRFAVADGYGSTRYAMVYQPVYPGGSSYDATAFVNPGEWFTITLPFSDSPDFQGKTLGDVIAQMVAAAYHQSGPWFENSGIKDVFDPIAATQKIYFDNIRIVPLSAPTYSDFPDDTTK